MLFKFVQSNLIFLILIVLLSACGYQLRGQAPGLASDQRLWVEGGDEALSSVLKKSILQNKAILLTGLNEKSTADSIISLGESKFSQSASAYNSEGDIIEYNIYYKLSFKINAEPYNFNATLSYDYNKAQLLSSEQNKNVATQEILDLAVVYILRQL